MVLKNGQITFVIILFVGLIIAASILPDIANQEELITGSFEVNNQTITVPAINASVDLTGRDLIEEITIINETSVASVDVVGLTLQRGIGTNGLLTVQLFANDTSSEITGNGVNVTYTYRADGFVGTGNIAVTQLIVIFAALAMVIFAIVMLFQSPLRDLFKN